ncbi:MAG: hypothetical protein LH624_03340 [Cryobacterium sp.]|nr:hypothetical protein [Cryobacterium sp.]
MPMLDRTDTITLDDGDYLYIETAANIVRLRRLSDSQVIDLTTAELARRLDGPTPSLPKPLHRYEDVAETQRTLSQKWVAHLEELTSGVHPVTGEQRPEYDQNTRTLNERVNAKVLEMAREGMKASRSTVMRKLADYRKDGVVGVIDGRALRNRNTLGNLHPDVLESLTASVAAQTNRSTGTVSRILLATKAELLKRVGAERASEILPHDSTLYVHANTLTQGLFTTGSAKTRRSTANQPKRKMATQIETLPGAQLQIDSTKMDLLVRTNSKKGYTRPVLTIMIDVATRSLVAFTIRLDAAKGIDHATLLAQALTPHENRPDKTQFRQWVQDTNPQCTLATPDERIEFERHRPYLHPRRIMTDNGKDFLSEVFLSAAQQFGVSITHSSPHTPTDKAIVERMFGTINTMFCQHLPGYVGRSPEHRGEKIEQENLLDVYALFELFDDWVLRDWQNRPHSSLRDHANPHVKMSPNEKFYAASEITSNMHIPLTRHDYIGLLPTVYAVIGSTGMRIRGLDYDATELQPLRRTRSTLKKRKGRWAVKVDPYNRQSVWVAGPDEQYIECTMRDADRFLSPTGFLSEAHPAELTERDEVATTMAELEGTDMHRRVTPATEANLTTTVSPVRFTRIPDLNPEESDDYVD